MPELDLRTEPNVAGQQSDHRRLRKSAESFEHAGDAGQDFPSSLMQHMVEPKNITIEEAAKVIPARLDLIANKELANDGSIGAPGEAQLRRPIRHFELHGANFAKSFFAGPAAVDQRPVDIKQHESQHCECLERDSLLSRVPS